MTIEPEVKITNQSGDASSNAGQNAGQNTWVHFEEDGSVSETAPAVINTESVQVNLERSNNNAISAVSDGNIGNLEPKPMQTVQLQVQEPVRQGFGEFNLFFSILVLKYFVVIVNFHF